MTLTSPCGDLLCFTVLDLRSNSPAFERRSRAWTRDACLPSDVHVIVTKTCLGVFFIKACCRNMLDYSWVLHATQSFSGRVMAEVGFRVSSWFASRMAQANRRVLSLLRLGFCRAENLTEIQELTLLCLQHAGRPAHHWWPSADLPMGQRRSSSRRTLSQGFTLQATEALRKARDSCFHPIPCAGNLPKS
jgi:hypothetical protein